MNSLSTTELFLLAMLIILALPYAVWRLGRTEHYAPLVVVQILSGIALGPGLAGAVFPQYYSLVFTPAVVGSLNGIAWWGVMVFVFLAGLELDLHEAWTTKRESITTATLALGLPLMAGGLMGWALLSHSQLWLGAKGLPWQFALGIGMSCAVTALPILILLMEKMAILRTVMGQRVLRYASLDDLAIWAVLAVILMDWQRVGQQILFLFIFGVCAYGLRIALLQFEKKLSEQDRWLIALIWLLACAFGADWCGLHFMVGAFIAGAVLDAKWFSMHQLDSLRHHVLLLLMPVFFLSTGLKTQWTAGGIAVIAVAALLLITSVSSKLLATQWAGRILGWQKGDAWFIGWLLQTKALIMIIFANVLLDKQIITHAMFTALLLMAVGSTMLTIPVLSRWPGSWKR